MRSVDEEALRTTTHRGRTTRLARTQNVSQPGSPSGNQGGTQDDRAWSDWDWFDVDLDVLGGRAPTTFATVEWCQRAPRFVRWPLPGILAFGPTVRPTVTRDVASRNIVGIRAGDGIRTRDVQLGKLAFYP